MSDETLQEHTKRLDDIETRLTSLEKQSCPMVPFEVDQPDTQPDTELSIQTKNKWPLIVEHEHYTVTVFPTEMTITSLAYGAAKVATLTYKIDPTSVQILIGDKLHRVSINHLVLYFHSDGRIHITNYGKDNFTYTLTHCLDRCSWVKTASRTGWWTNGTYSIGHTVNPEAKPVSTVSTHGRGLCVTLHREGGTILTVGPAGTPDHSKLYGEHGSGAWFAVYSYESLLWVSKHLGDLLQYGVRIIAIMAGLYKNPRGPSCAHIPCRTPKDQGGNLYYAFQYSKTISEFLKGAHAKGIQVCHYINGPAVSLLRGTRSDALSICENLQNDYGFDGVYIDCARIEITNWIENHRFLQDIRNLYPQGPVILHNTVDLWGGASGRVWTPAFPYVDIVHTGESGLARDLKKTTDYYFVYVVQHTSPAFSSFVGGSLVPGLTMADANKALTKAKGCPRLSESYHNSLWKAWQEDCYPIWHQKALSPQENHKE